MCDDCEGWKDDTSAIVRLRLELESATCFHGNAVLGC